MIAKGKWPRTTAVIQMNLSMEPLNIKFQSASKKAANSTAKITMVSVILKPNYKFLKELGLLYSLSIYSSIVSFPMLDL